MIPFSGNPPGGAREPLDHVEVELVHIAFAVDLVHDLLVVVVADGPAELIVIHAGFPLPEAPEGRDSLRVDQLEFPLAPRPCDDGSVLLVLEELEKELPELDLT